MPQKKTVIFTYNGLDGACCAAALLLKYPAAQLTVTSARRISQSVSRISENMPDGSFKAVYICGLGVNGGWDTLQNSCKKLRKHGVSIKWFCGRGYMDPYEERLNPFCSPVFSDVGTNTAAVCNHLGIAGEKQARKLMDLSLLDSNLRTHDRDPTGGKNRTQEQRLWTDMVEAAVSQYFKYQDPETYKRVIRHLAAGSPGDEDIKLVEIYRRHGSEHSLRGKSEKMKNLRELIRMVAAAGEHVLVTGDSGVGKEYVARLIHEAGERTMEPMITVNCALFAGNEGLADSVLFGHVRGAFTGASRDREGAFISADGGVLFLDELATMPLEVQGKLLRVIEDGSVTPIGCDRPIAQVDVRVIAATNRNLPQMVRDSEFREDLFHRLDVLRIRLPSLKEHREDIAYIAEHLLRSVQGQHRRAGLSEGEKNTLESYNWPGNVRQLRKVIKRATLLKLPIEDVLAEEKIYLGTQAEGEGCMFPNDVADIADIREIQHKYAEHAFRINGENLSDTARRLNISPNTLKKYISM